jgi:ribosomal protein S18 acetylase RimI-like enzyme
VVAVTYTVTGSDDAGATIDAAREFLESSPVLHNLVLTLLHQRAITKEAGRYWVVRDGSDVVGVVFQSPLEFRATLTPMPPEAARTAAEAIAGQNALLPGIEGEARSSAAFTGHWTQVRRTGARPVLGMRLLRLGRLTLPVGIPGRLRLATAADMDLVQGWAVAFTSDVGEAPPPEAAVAGRVEQGELALWETDGIPVCMSGRSPDLAGVVRIGPVYTPPEHRRRGYAGACVGEHSREAVEMGFSCMLYTDLHNPTSNSVYRALGYEAVSENVRYEFGDPSNT